MSINVACLCKQPLNICPKKASKHLYTCDKGDSVPFSDVKPPFSPPGQYAATLGHLFALALFVLLKPKDRKYVGPGFYMNRERERFLGVLQSSFCFSQILCYEPDKSQILVRNASLKRPQSAFKQEEYFTF